MFNKKLLLQIQTDVDFIKKEIIKMSTTPPVTQAEFDAGLSDLETKLTAQNTAVNAALTDLMTKVTAGTPIDLSSELARIQVLAQNAVALTSTATSDDPSLSTVTPTTPPITGSGSEAPATPKVQVGAAHD